MTRTIPLAALAAALALPGCCDMARMWCGIKPPKTIAAGSRDTPEDAVDFLVDAFRNRKIDDLYTSMHPEFRRENGNFTQEEFAIAYQKFEPDFLADAESLAAAARSDVQYDPSGTLASIRLRNDRNGAEVQIFFMDQPRIRVVTKDPFVGTIEDQVDMANLVRLEQGRLALPADVPLPVSSETAAALRSEDVLRVEIHHDWRVRSVPREAARNIRFLDRIKEYVGR